MRWALALVLAASCHPGVTSGVKASDAILTITTNVHDAALWLDGRLLAPLDALRGGIAVDAGRHRLELRRDDYFSAYVEVEARAAEHRTIAMPLSPVLP